MPQFNTLTQKINFCRCCSALGDTHPRQYVRNALPTQPFQARRLQLLSPPRGGHWGPRPHTARPVTRQDTRPQAAGLAATSVLLPRGHYFLGGRKQHRASQVLVSPSAWDVPALTAPHAAAYPSAPGGPGPRRARRAATAAPLALTRSLVRRHLPGRAVRPPGLSTPIGPRFPALRPASTAPPPNGRCLPGLLCYRCRPPLPPR